MTTFLRITAACIVSVVLTLLLSRQNKDISLVLSVFVCCLVLYAAMEPLKTVFSFLGKLESIASLDSQSVKILFKMVGIGLVAQVAMLICTDSGNAALGKCIQIFAAAVILVQSLPLMQGLLELLQKILGEL